MEHELPKADSLNGVNISLANIAKSVDRLEIKIDKIQDQSVTRPEYMELVIQVKKQGDILAEVKTFKDGVTGQMIAISGMAGLVMSALGVLLEHFLVK